MEKTKGIDRLYKVLIFFVFITFLWSVFRARPVNIIEPIIQARAGRSAQLDFEINKSGPYQFSLLFSKGYNSKDEVELRKKLTLFGSINSAGKMIPVSLRLIKDGKMVFDEKIETVGTVREHSFYRNESNIRAMVRNIKIAYLPPGRYSLKITLLKDMADFDRIPIYAHAIYFTPENLARVENESREMDRKMNSYWYNGWLFTRFLVKSLWCVKFCDDPLHRYKLLDVTHAGQSVTIDFEIKKDEYYKFTLLFDQGGTSEEIHKRTALFGDVYKGGVTVPISLSLIKDGKVYYENTLETNGYFSSKNIRDEERKKTVYVAERLVKILELQSGYYSATFTILTDNPALNGISGFAGVSYYMSHDKFIF
ncbi:DUF5625 family protein [Erwinia sp. BNK-24-b]|uniref:DUF5625 family protein n=1 Tax=unclassified Erwinia TaxID=2622719 RepID=UPI0039BF6C26